MLVVVLWILACLLGGATQARALESDYDASVDGFDDSAGLNGVKSVTDVNALNLNPFQVELFVSYCVS